MKERIGFVFIHGAGLESRIWGQVVTGLESPSLLVDFPEREGDKTIRQSLSLQDYITHIKQQIQAWDVLKFVIVAHSLGGVLALKIAEDFSDRLVGFVAVGATIPSQGGSFLSVLPFAQRTLMRVLLRAFGTQPPESAIRKGLCNDLSPDQANEVVRGFAPESVRVYTDRIEALPPRVPKLYLKLMNDQEMNPSHQDKMIANLAPQHVEVLESGHLPMLSKPDELRFALNSFLLQLDAS
ncbi:alpha/beta fold hydrolase [Paenibacillus sedimenti]|uniref:Alpha/beta hydrolase n=1 Tax=Paenibacillus sedimenti TaxID=2770274 RepID=A0A926KU75_9BACL|nr:alpha/beta hydrolase [Paenibacillus sedimenti]MBD0383221.1 alpha/beta hydrolase [Paenibacillus sedimenti]